MVVDADALNAFGGGKAELIFAAQKKYAPRNRADASSGEMARLLNLTPMAFKPTARKPCSPALN